MTALRTGPALRVRMAGPHVDPMLLRVQLHALNGPWCDDPEQVTIEFGVLYHLLPRTRRGRRSTSSYPRQRRENRRNPDEVEKAVFR